MGQVYLAKHSKVDGIEKFCVVKTLRRQFTDDEDYVERFVDEARIVVHLGHRNICQVFDVGKVGERYYLAMEYIPGRDVRRLLDAAWTRGLRMPLDLATHVVSQVLEALDYAHRHVHPATGKPLGLVHRDVSPQNVMINLEGEVKLIDFGLAASNLKKDPEEDSGVVMGKLAYMSPEQLCGDTVDGRSDVFSTAIVAYEIFTGSRFYEGMKRADIWDAALDGHRPERFHEVPPGLREILDEALARNVEERLTCEQFLEALEGWRHEQRHAAGARQLRAFMASLYPQEQTAVRSLLLKYATTEPVEAPPSFEQSISIARSDLSPTTSLRGLSSKEPTLSLTMSTTSSPDGRAVVEGDDGEPVEESAGETARLLPPPPPEVPDVRRRSSPLPLVAAAATGALMVGLTVWAFSDDPPPPPASTPAADVDEAPPAPPAPTPASPEAVAPQPTERPVAATPAPPTPPPTRDKVAQPKPPAEPASPTTRPPDKPAPRLPATAAPTPPIAPAASPEPKVKTTTAAPTKRLTFMERIELLHERCPQLACSKALVGEFRGKNLPDIPTKRLAPAVAEIRKCVESCRGAE
jgi:serine/threonine-protein kinase